MDSDYKERFFFVFLSSSYYSSTNVRNFVYPFSILKIVAILNNASWVILAVSKFACFLIVGWLVNLKAHRMYYIYIFFDSKILYNVEFQIAPNAFRILFYSKILYTSLVVFLFLLSNSWELEECENLVWTKSGDHFHDRKSGTKRSRFYFLLLDVVGISLAGIRIRVPFLSM